MQKKRNKNRRRMSINNLSGIRRVFTLNIGTVVFGILFIYMIISIILYITHTHVASYLVTSGPLAKNQTYTGLAFYSEEVVRADTGGYVTYFASENTKVKAGGVVYGISQSPTVKNNVTVSGNTLEEIRSDLQSFTLGYDPSDFHDVYSLKYAVESAIVNQSLRELKANGNTVTIGNETISTAEHSGIVVYATDGYENRSINDLTPEMLDEKSYHITSLKSGDAISAGDAVYKLIDSESWSVVIPLTSRQIVSLGDLKRIKVNFLRDQVSQVADFSILPMSDGNYYGRLDFSSGLSRHLDSRFVDIELVTNNEIGLKVPVSSVVTKEFYTIPEEYIASKDEQNQITVCTATTDVNGNIHTDYKTVTAYEDVNGRYYVDLSAFGAGDVILKDGTTSVRYIIRDKAALEGVYCMNKGYTEFRRIDIIDKNEQYCIVREGTRFGISQYDNIVLDAATVKEAQITA